MAIAHELEKIEKRLASLEAAEKELRDNAYHVSMALTKLVEAVKPDVTDSVTSAYEDSTSDPGSEED